MRIWARASKVHRRKVTVLKMLDLGDLIRSAQAEKRGRNVQQMEEAVWGSRGLKRRSWGGDHSNEKCTASSKTISAWLFALHCNARHV